MVGLYGSSGRTPCRCSDDDILMLRRRFFLRLYSFSARLAFGLVAVVLVTTLAAGAPAYWLTRSQLERQAELQVLNLRRATRSLLDAEQERLDNLALLFAERPTLRRLVSEHDLDELSTYLAAFQTQSDLDLLLVCGND